MMRLSIRLRLTAWIGVVLTAILVILGCAVYLVMRHALVERIDSELTFELEEISEELSVQEVNNHAISMLPEAFLENFLFQVRDQQGHIQLQSAELEPYRILLDRLVPDEHLATTRTIDLDRLGPYRILTGRIARPGGPLTVLIASSLQTIDNELAELRATLLTILPAGLIAILVGGYWLAGRALAPIHRMTEAARQISAQSLHERIEVINPNDELGRLAETLNAMIDRLDRAFDAMRRFTADASHELKTPLTAIRAEAEVALHSSRSVDHLSDVLESIIEETERLTRLADRLLLLSREDAGTAPGDRHCVHLVEVLRQCVEHVHTVAGHAGVTIRLASMSDVLVQADKDRLRQIFDNLLDNAIKYNRPGGRVDVLMNCDDGYVIVDVRDTGIGVPDDVQDFIFDRFYRVDASRSRKTGGTGLGLSIARTLVESLHGSIHLTSTLGVGSTFQVRFPLANNGNGRAPGPPFAYSHPRRQDNIKEF